MAVKSLERENRKKPKDRRPGKETEALDNVEIVEDKPAPASKSPNWGLIVAIAVPVVLVVLLLAGGGLLTIGYFSVKAGVIISKKEESDTAQKGKDDEAEKTRKAFKDKHGYDLY